MILYAVASAVAVDIAQRSVAGYLSQPELRRYNSLTESARLDFLSGRVALKAAVRHYCSLPIHELAQVAVENAPDGRPDVNQTGLYCSLAHSCGWGVGAASAQPIGVDIERVSPRSVELLRYISDEAEREAAGSDNGGYAELIARIWTLKEAVLKGMGIGLTVAPRQLTVRKAQGGRFLVEVSKSVASEPLVWNAHSYAVDGFCISVATREEPHEQPHISWYHSPDVHTAVDALLSRRA
ncbi:MAG: 4'-phosphopantetheinyl transferase superfamily protein [Chloroflexota bacterium]|nr:4'-phosphopantetheinyl transferase superfamily protein [Chloroflexota bacterium]